MPGFWEHLVPQPLPKSVGIIWWFFFAFVQLFPIYLRCREFDWLYCWDFERLLFNWNDDTSLIFLLDTILMVVMLQLIVVTCYWSVGGSSSFLASASFRAEPSLPLSSLYVRSRSSSAPPSSSIFSQYLLFCLAVLSLFLDFLSRLPVCHLLRHCHSHFFLNLSLIDLFPFRPHIIIILSTARNQPIYFTYIVTVSLISLITNHIWSTNHLPGLTAWLQFATSHICRKGF